MADGLYLPLGSAAAFEAVPAFVNFVLNATTDQAEWVFAVDNDGSGNLTITHIGFRYGVRTGTPPTFIGSIQGVGTDGNPDGTIKGGGTPASATFTPPADSTWNSTWRWIALANSYTAAPGEMLAIVIAYSSGTINGSNSSSFSINVTNASTIFPYSINNDAGSRTRMAAGNMAITGYKTASKAYGRPLQAVATVTLQVASSPAEAAMKFTVPAGWTDTYTICGARFLANCAAANTVNMTLYNGGGAGDVTVLQDYGLDTDALAAASARQIRLPFNETSLSSLTAGSTYRFGLSSAGAVDVAVNYIEVATDTDWEAWPFGDDFTYSHRDAGGNWTDTTTRRLLSEVCLASITEESVGGGADMLFVAGGRAGR